MLINSGAECVRFAKMTFYLHKEKSTCGLPLSNDADISKLLEGLSALSYKGTFSILQGAGDEAYLVTCPEHSKIRNELDLVPQMPIMPDQRISPDVPPPRSHSGRAERNHSSGGSGGPNSKTCMTPPAKPSPESHRAI